MPAVSKAQQQAAGIALAAKRGKIHPSKLQGASQEMYNSMEDSDLNDFASTDTKRLPDRKEEKLREYIRKAIQEILDETESLDEDVIRNMSVDDMKGFDGNGRLIDKINEIIKVVNMMVGDLQRMKQRMK